MQREKKWFLRGLDTDTHNKIASELDFGSSFFKYLPADIPRGIRDNLWECSLEKVEEFKESADSKGLWFEIWWTFDNEPLRKSEVIRPKGKYRREARRFIRSEKERINTPTPAPDPSRS